MRRDGAPPVRTVFLDLGDTLMYVHPSVPALYRQACADLGLSVTPARVAAALREGERVYREAQRGGRAFESSMQEARAFWQSYNELLLREMGVVGDNLQELARALSERFWSPPSWHLFPEVHEVLRTLRAAGMQLAVISNFTEALVAVCEAHELSEYFDCVVASAAVGSQKPDTGIFREALRRTGADPAAAVHAGDNYVADVLGARAAGIDGVLVDRTLAGGRGMYDFALRSGIGGSAGVRLDCPVIGDLRGLLALIPRS